MIHLAEVRGGQPFQDHPQLLEIWPEPFRRLAQEGVAESFASDAPADIGVFLILEDDQVIGITGYFLYNEDGSELGLRWHGVIPAKRGQRISEQAICQVLVAARARHPHAHTLIELVPLTEYGQPLERHFTALGFVPVGAPEQFDWAENHWQPYHFDIDHFFATLLGTAKRTKA